MRTRSDELFNPYDPPGTPLRPTPRTRPVATGPCWVRFILMGNKLPGMSLRRSALVWMRVAQGLVVALWLAAIASLGQDARWLGGWLLMGAVAELVAAEWLRRAVGWVDRHDGW